MHLIAALTFLLALPNMAFAQDVDPLGQYQWHNRPLVIFADTPDDPRFRHQMEMLAITPDELESRDVVILTDTDPDADGPLRQTLHPRDFMLVLIGKDGTVALRKPFPWSVRELSRAIDKMPMRQEELRQNGNQ